MLLHGNFVYGSARFKYLDQVLALVRVTVRLAMSSAKAVTITTNDSEAGERSVKPMNAVNARLIGASYGIEVK